jgi:outer membrane protein assembly factor BamB
MRGIRLFGSLAIIACLSAALFGQDWPYFRGPAKNGVADGKAFDAKAIEAGKIAWELNIGTGYSAPAIVGGKVFVLGYQGGKEVLAALDEKTGKQLWATSFASSRVDYEGSRSSPVVDGGKIYFITNSGDAHCVDAATGKTLWSTDMFIKIKSDRPEWAFSSSALIEGKLVIYNLSNGGVALDKDTGALVWGGKGGMPGYASPVAFGIGAERYLAMFGARELQILKPADGKKIASFPWVTSYDCNAADPLVIPGKASADIFISSNYGKGCAMLRFDGKTLTKLWQNGTVNAHFQSPVLVGGVIYACDGSPNYGSLVALDPASGKALWDQWSGFASLIAVGNIIVSANEGGAVVAFEADKAAYKEIAQTFDMGSLIWTAPVYANGRLYLRSDSGRLVALAVGK